ncbi:unnamed protein product [Sphagnum compactum]
MRGIKVEREGEPIYQENQGDRDVAAGGKSLGNSRVGLRSVPANVGRLRCGRFVHWAVIAIILTECVYIIQLDVLNESLKSVYSSYSKSMVFHRKQQPQELEGPQGLGGLEAQKELVGGVEGQRELAGELEGWKELAGGLEGQKGLAGGIEGQKGLVVGFEGQKGPGGLEGHKEVLGGRQSSCSEEWLENADRVKYTRDFVKQPVLIVYDETKEWNTCAVPCVYRRNDDGPADGAFGVLEGVPQIHRSMESSAYFPDNDLQNAHRYGITVVMTTSLSSDVPVGYFSWFEYPIMDPPEPKTKSALAAAFISNCGAHNERLRFLELLQQEGIKVDSYGACNQNVVGGRGVDKVEALRKYKFSLSFENSNVEDYVTEKFFQALVAGSIPVVVGPPNIQDFAPAPNSYLYIKHADDVKGVAAKMKFLAENATAYNDTIRWKYEGPSDSFLALVDMAVVHSSCRLCIHLATKIRMKEDAAVASQRPCKCTSKLGTLHHLYVRERGRFEPESIFLKESSLTVKKLKEAVLRKFTAIKHEPIWKKERPEMIQGDPNLRIYRIYPVGLTQREALYSWSFKDNSEFKEMVLKNPCSNFEVIFV